MTVMEQRGAYRPTPPPAWQPRTDPAPLLPDALPYRVLGTDAAADADPALLRRLYAELVRGRRYNTQATALTKQGRLAVYPSSTGQEACEVAAALVLEDRDWLFPSYRDTLAAVARGLDPVQALTLLRGDWHTGYDPHEHRVAPLCTPLATQLPHAVGLAHAARLQGDDVVALALVGDGGTSEGDFHEALNFAAVWQAPVVFLVQNNGFAISVPLAKQTAAPSLAHKAVGYGMPGRLVDGNDAAAVHQVLAEAVAHARGWRSHTGRGGDVPHRRPHQRRRRDPLPGRRRGRDLARARPDRAPGARADRARPPRRGRHPGRPRRRRDDGGRPARAHEPGPGPRPHGPLRPRLRRTHPHLREQEALLRAELAAEQEGAHR